MQNDDITRALWARSLPGGFTGIGFVGINLSARVPNVRIKFRFKVRSSSVWGGLFCGSVCDLRGIMLPWLVFLAGTPKWLLVSCRHCHLVMSMIIREIFTTWVEIQSCELSARVKRLWFRVEHFSVMATNRKVISPFVTGSRFAA